MQPPEASESEVPFAVSSLRAALLTGVDTLGPVAIESASGLATGPPAVAAAGASSGWEVPVDDGG